MASLIPKPPKKPLAQMMAKEGQVLRFSAKLVGCRKADAERRFVVSFFLSDETVAVFEPPARNSGRVAGKIVQRVKLKNPRSGGGAPEAERYFVPQDFYVGAVVDIFANRYLLTDADEYAFRYMEDHRDEFPVADVDAVVAKLRDHAGGDPAAAFAEFDTDGSGFVEPAEFQAALLRLGCDVVGHELLTLMRHFDYDGDGRIHTSELIRALG